MGIRVLIVEDDEDINRFIVRCLQKESYETTSAYSGTEANLLLNMQSFDLILLDLMLPGIKGETLLTEIRKTSQVPIIVLSAKVALEDKVHVLKDGADDYITKPFEKDELLARVQTVLRRSKTSLEPDKEEVLQFKKLKLFPEKHIVMINDKELNLTASEFDILLVLMQNQSKAFTKDQLYQCVWKDGYYGEDNTISVHISNIRKKIKVYDEDSYIKTVWGIGFKMDTSPSQT